MKASRGCIWNSRNSTKTTRKRQLSWEADLGNGLLDTSLAPQRTFLERQTQNRPSRNLSHTAFCRFLRPSKLNCVRQNRSTAVRKNRSLTPLLFSPLLFQQMHSQGLPQPPCNCFFLLCNSFHSQGLPLPPCNCFFLLCDSCPLIFLALILVPQPQKLCPNSSNWPKNLSLCSETGTPRLKFDEKLLKILKNWLIMFEFEWFFSLAQSPCEYQV